MVEVIEPYDARPVLHSVGGGAGDRRIKKYAIVYRREAGRPELIEAAEAAAAGVLPTPAVTPTRYGVGFLGVQDRSGANFVFVDFPASPSSLVGRELPQHLTGNPAGRAVVALDRRGDHGQDTFAEVIVAFASLPQCPAGTLMDIGSLVLRRGNQRREQADERVVFRLLVMDGEEGNKDEARSLHELFWSSRPHENFAARERSAPEEVLATLVANLPAVEGLRPAVHLRVRDSLWVVHQRCQNPWLANGCAPELQGEPMVGADPLRDRAHHG
jgi:hypothetical protein